MSILLLLAAALAASILGVGAAKLLVGWAFRMLGNPDDPEEAHRG